MDKCLNQSVVHLKDESLSLYREYIEEVKGAPNSDATVQLLLAEVSYCYLHFYKYEDAEATVAEALRLGNLDLNLTGKLGKRTLYQQTNIA
jgi:hypothetical protein